MGSTRYVKGHLPGFRRDHLCAGVPISLEWLRLVVQMQRIQNQRICAYGCYQTPSSLEVDSLDATDVYEGVQSYGLRKVLLQRSRFTDVWTVANLGGDTATATSLTATARGDAFYLFPDSAGSITSSSFACAAGSNGDAIQAQGNGVLTVAGNTVTGDCNTGIYFRSYRQGEARGNTIALSGGSLQHGIQSYQGLGPTQAIVGNTISGAFCAGAIRAEGVTGSAVRVDSNTVTGASELGVWARYGDTVRIRDNVVSGIRGGQGCQTYHARILLEGNEYQTLNPIIQIQRNRLFGNERGIVLHRFYPDSAVVVVDTNRIVGSVTTGILVTNYSRVLARSNVIDSTHAVGVLVDRSGTPSQGDTLAVLFANNNITRNAKHGVYNPTTGPLEGSSTRARTGGVARWGRAVRWCSNSAAARRWGTQRAARRGLEPGRGALRSRPPSPGCLPDALSRPAAGNKIRLRQRGRARRLKWGLLRYSHKGLRLPRSFPAAPLPTSLRRCGRRWGASSRNASLRKART